MKFSLRHLVIILIFGAALIMAFGCTQHDDIVKPQNRASITIRPLNLPTLDTLYAYELWMLTLDGSDSAFTSLGKFLWDNYEFRFTDLSGEYIDSVYEVPGIWEDYDYIVVTVENRNDPDPGPSGSIMLVDEVDDPVARPISLRFPADFSMTTGYYFTGTPSDDNDDTDEEKGLWICARALSERRLQDTLGIENTTLTKTQQDTLNRERTDPDTIGVANYTFFDSTIVVIGYDTIWDHKRIDVEWVDTVDTNNDYILRVDYETGDSTVLYYYIYAGPLEELPDIKPFGWRYNAWVFHEYFPSEANLSRMVPFGYERQFIFTGDTTWQVLPLGAFFRSDSCDLSNSYNDQLEVPQFPGEDFIIDPGPLGSIDLRYDGADATGGEWGSIVVGMEPIPDVARINVDTTRNFPLFILSDFLLSASYAEVDEVHAFHNWGQFLPQIRLSVVFHE
jgi:hypothetical protein